MTETVQNLQTWPMEFAADAGKTTAFLANSFFDSVKAAEGIYKGNDFYKYVQLAGDLVGEGSLGDKAELMHHLGYTSLQEMEPSVDGVMLNIVGDLTAYDLGLRPRVNKEQVKAIGARLNQSITAISKIMATEPWDTNFDSPWNYAVVRTGADITVAFTGSVALKRDYWSSRPDTYVNPCEEGEDEHFLAMIDGAGYDIRAGMTRSTYLALRKRYGRDIDGRHHPRDYATVITGERTPRNGYWLANRDGSFEPIAPQALQGSVPQENDQLLSIRFRPAVILKDLLGE